jgi:hypothetical protein
MTHGRNVCPCNWPIKKQIEHFAPLCKQLSKAKTTREFKNIIKNEPKCVTKFLSECSKAILREDIHLADYSKLKEKKTKLISLADPTTSLDFKTNALTKKGGFLSLLPILGGLVANTLLPLIINKFTKK